MDAHIEKLLILHDRDLKKLDIDSQLESIPREISLLERKIAAEKEALEEASTKYKELEVKRSDLDNQVKTAETKVLKYRNQQLEVKKNDEYQALTAEIANMETTIGGLEEEEIAIMLEIDEQKEFLAGKKTESDERMRLLDKEISNLKEREKTLKLDLEGAISAVLEAEKGVHAPYKAAYDKVKRVRKKGPFVAALDENRCKGCHLKVSGEVVSLARHYKEEPRPVTCDSCGRIVYWPY